MYNHDNKFIDECIIDHRKLYSVPRESNLEFPSYQNLVTESLVYSLQLISVH